MDVVVSYPSSYDEQRTKTLSTLLNKCQLVQVLGDMEEKDAQLVLLEADKLINKQKYYLLPDELIKQTRQFIQGKLGIEEANLRNDRVRNQELAKLMFYYLLKNEEPAGFVEQIIEKVIDPVETSLFRWSVESKLSRILQMAISQNYMFQEELLELIHDFLRERKLRQDDQLFDNFFIHLLLVLPENDRNDLLINTLNRKHQTLLHTQFGFLMYEPIFGVIHPPLSSFEMFEFLSIKDINGQTVLHTHSHDVLRSLLWVQRRSDNPGMFESLSINDINGETVLHIHSHNVLCSLLEVQRRSDNPDYAHYLFEFLTIEDNEGNFGVDINDIDVRDSIEKFLKIMAWENNQEPQDYLDIWYGLCQISHEA